MHTKLTVQGVQLQVQDKIVFETKDFCVETQSTPEEYEAQLVALKDMMTMYANVLTEQLGK